ncbi:MAG TPA: hypothetical protein PKU68_05805 [Bacillota bacterium]|nr:hypothetical protein [Bacillota bacterium]
MSNPANWIAAFLTLAIYSILFKESEIYYVAETIFVGTTAGYAVAMTFGNRIKPAIMIDILEKGKWNYIVPIILGLLMYTRFSRKLQWLSNYPIAFTVGIGAGVVLTKQWKPMLIDQVIATIKPLSDPTTAQVINSLLLLIGVICTLSFFIFTKEAKGVLSYSSRIGRYTMMIAFGAAFGTTVMARVSLFLSRMQFLLIDWLGIAK